MLCKFGKAGRNNLASILVFSQFRLLFSQIILIGNSLFIPNTVFKGLFMDRCVLLTSTPECVVSPRWAIPIITWCWRFPSFSTNILLIKSQLKLRSKAIAVGVAMPPRNLGSKYRCRPHPRLRKCTRQFFYGKQIVLNRTAPERRHRVATTPSIMWCV